MQNTELTLGEAVSPDKLLIFRGELGMFHNTLSSYTKYVYVYYLAKLCNPNIHSSEK